MSVSLVRYDAARQALAAAHSVDEVKEIRDKAQALAAYARQANDTAMVEWVTEIKVRAERRAGELLRDMEERGERRGRGGNQKSNSHDESLTLAELGVSENQSARWQKLAAVPEEKFEQAVAAAKEVAGEVTTAALLRMGQGLAPLMSSESMEWYTPPEIIKATVTLLGAIDLDPCADPNRKVPAKKHFTVQDDGLHQPWSGRVYMNPPYGRGIEQWVSKLVMSYNSGPVTAAVALVPARTDTEWMKALREFTVLFVHGRLHFSGSENSAPFPSALVYLGHDQSGFDREFGAMGDVRPKARNRLVGGRAA